VRPGPLPDDGRSLQRFDQSALGRGNARHAAGTGAEVLSSRRARIRHYSGESSRTTHGAQECIDACRLFGEMLARAIDGAAEGGYPVFGRCGGTLSSAASPVPPARGDYRARARRISGSGLCRALPGSSALVLPDHDSFGRPSCRLPTLGDDAQTPPPRSAAENRGAHYGRSGIPRTGSSS